MCVVGGEEATPPSLPGRHSAQAASAPTPAPAPTPALQPHLYPEARGYPLKTSMSQGLLHTSCCSSWRRRCPPGAPAQLAGILFSTVLHPPLRWSTATMISAQVKGTATSSSPSTEQGLAPATPLPSLQPGCWTGPSVVWYLQVLGNGLHCTCQAGIRAIWIIWI